MWVRAEISHRLDLSDHSTGDLTLKRICERNDSGFLTELYTVSKPLLILHFLVSKYGDTVPSAPGVHCGTLWYIVVTVPVQGAGQSSGRRDQSPTLRLVQRVVPVMKNYGNYGFAINGLFTLHTISLVREVREHAK